MGALASVEAIQKRTNVAVGGLMTAWALKVVNRHLDRLERKIATLGNLPAHDAVEELVRLVTEVYFINRKHMRTLFELTTRKKLSPVVFQARQRAVAMIEALLMRYPRGCLKPGDPRLAATMLVNAMLGILEMAIVDPFPEVSDEMLTHELSALVRRYLFSD